MALIKIFRLLCLLTSLTTLAGMAVSSVASATATLNALSGQTAYPVDITGGQKFLADEDETDFVLPPRQPVVWQRYWCSNWQFSGAAGIGWNFQHETALYYRPDAVIWQSPEGDNTVHWLRYGTGLSGNPQEMWDEEGSLLWLAHSTAFGELKADTSCITERHTSRYASPDNTLTKKPDYTTICTVTTIRKQAASPSQTRLVSKVD